MDYGRRISFGYFPPPVATGYPTLLEGVRAAEEIGLELVGIQDHPYQAAFLDTWTLIAALAPQAPSLTFFPDVANLPLRPPAVLAKAAASLDVISGGRVELGLGSGAFWPAVRAMGGRVLERGDAVSALEEAIEVVRLMWGGERAVRFRGRFYSLDGVRPGPPPAHSIGIWLGAYGPRMLRVTGRLADGWVPSGPPYLAPEDVGEASARIDDAAASAGREPRHIRRLYNVWGMVTDGPAAGGESWEWPADRWVDLLTRLALEDGVDSFVFGPSRDPVSQLRRWAEEVAAPVRTNVERARRRAG